MKAREMRELSADELRNRERDLAEQLFKLRLQHNLGQLENAAKLGNVRREIARIKTVLEEMERGKE
jgi:large subunit ribosomal protein L29